jgi:hypothetical protein
MKALRTTFFLLGFLFISFSAYARRGKPVRVLWVIDDEYLNEVKDEAGPIKNKIIGLAESLDVANVPYKMAVTTTDVFSNQGALISDGSGHTIVDGNDYNRFQIFGGLLDHITVQPTSFWRQGLEASILVLKQSQNFIDDNTALSIVFLSAEDDYSCAAECYGVEPWDNKTWVRNPPGNYVAAYRALKTKKGVDVSLYPIVGLSNDTCAVRHIGVNYVVAQGLMGSGISGSVCTKDLSESISKISAQIVSAYSNQSNI